MLAACRCRAGRQDNNECKLITITEQLTNMPKPCTHLASASASAWMMRLRRKGMMPTSVIKPQTTATTAEIQSMVPSPNAFHLCKCSSRALPPCCRSISRRLCLAVLVTLYLLTMACC